MNCQWATSHLCKQHTPFGLYLVVFPFAYLILRCFHLMALLSIMPYLKGRCWMARFTVFSSLRFLFSCCIQTDPALVTAVLTPPLCHLPWGAVLMVKFLLAENRIEFILFDVFSRPLFSFQVCNGCISSIFLVVFSTHFTQCTLQWEL